MGKCRRKVRCTLCTPYKWLGNAKERFKGKETAAIKRMQREAKDVK